MPTNCSEYISNLSIPQTDNFITVQDALGIVNKQYMSIITYCVVALCLYVLYTNFIMDTRLDIFQRTYKIFDFEVLPIDIHELAILPAIALVIIMLAYYGVI